MPSPLTSLTLMVCTYQRPQYFAQFMGSLARLNVPAGFAFEVVVADNNPQSQFDAYIAALIAGCPHKVTYGHEGTRGYSSARNKAVELALKTASSHFAFIDDDMLLDPEWLNGQIRAYGETAADAIEGQTLGHKTKYEPNEVLQTAGMRNISFSRSFVDAEGLGLRFDRKYNEIGYEDHYFTLSATEAGKVIRSSRYPVVIDPSVSDGETEEELRNKAAVAIVAQHNKIVMLKQSKGVMIAALVAALSTARIFKVIGHRIEALAFGLAGKAPAAMKARISSTKEWGKIAASFSGVTGGFKARQDIRRGG